MQSSPDILRLALACHSAGSDLRTRRRRFKQFTYGRQWDDPVNDPVTSALTTEGELAARSGRRPLTNNMIRRLVKTIVGHFRTALVNPDSLQAAISSEVDPKVRAANCLDELDARTLEEFLISGCAIQRVSIENRPAGPGPWIDMVSPEQFFCSPFTDPRALDIETVGMLHDLPLPEVIGRFAAGSRRKAEEIRRIYSGSPRCRVVEVWTLEAVEQLRCHDPKLATYYALPAAREAELTAINRRRSRRKEEQVTWRFEVTTAWHGRWLGPEGQVLAHTVAPTHPFAVKFYPMIDGEVHSFVEDVIDQQKYVNRLITLVDNVMSTSAKGVLLFPQDDLSPKMDLKTIASEWSRHDGVIVYDPQPGSPGPRQVVTNASSLGAYDLLSLEMKMLQEVSGITDAYQGRNAANSAQLYEAQARHTAAALADIFDTFATFRRARNKLLLQL